MLRRVKDMEKFSLNAVDGDIGSIKDFYFDDEAWVIRYLVVDTSAWLTGRKVLVSPYSLGIPDVAGKSFPVSIKKDQVRNSPSIDTDRPVSRQYETSYLDFYGYPPYWGGPGIWSDRYYPMVLADNGYEDIGMNYRHGLTARARAQLEVADQRRKSDDPHLRSCNAVVDYRVHASDGEIGHIQGFLVDDRSWSIRYLIVNTSNWWMGHLVLVDPEWVSNVSWSQQQVSVDMTRQAIKAAPAYDDSKPLDRVTETLIYSHYGRPTYWKTPVRREVA